MIYSQFCESSGTSEDKRAQSIKSQHLALSMNVCDLQRCASSSSDVQPCGKAACELNCPPPPPFLLCFSSWLGCREADTCWPAVFLGCGTLAISGPRREWFKQHRGTWFVHLSCWDRSSLLWLLPHLSPASHSVFLWSGLSIRSLLIFYTGFFYAT